MTKPIWTTKDAARYCHVTPMTVLNWIKAGRLEAHRTPGGHYRIRRDDFKDFLKRHNMPIHADLFPEERKKILVVDDELGVVHFILTTLRKRFPHFEYSTASNGYEAGFQAATLIPDLVILDIRMPGMDGFEVCQKIKTSPETMSAKVLVITGFPDEDQGIQRIIGCGAEDVLVKPFSPNELISKVSSLIM